MSAVPSAAPLDPEGVGTNAPSSQPKKVAYFYDNDVGNYAYPTGHYMKPHRIRMAHQLILNYGIHKKMEIYRAKPASSHEMTQFHTDEYIDFLKLVTPDSQHRYPDEIAKFNLSDDCPVWDGMFEYCAISAGGSMEGAARLNRDKCDVAINWAGGLHHAKKNTASGFCYVNDIVLSILELLRFHRRVLYIDIDVHHGDGVEEAFFTTDRVMCVSFHKFGQFFPGTGTANDTGIGRGKNYSVNFPLNDGIDDATYKDIFESVIGWTMEFYQPSAIVLQCGADSLSGDRLGAFNLSMRGHANCVNFVKKFNVPLLILGGGGYTIKNVARVWAYETGQAVGIDMNPEMPFSDYYEYYAPDYELDVKPGNMANRNSAQYISRIKRLIYEQLRETEAVPSVQMQPILRNPFGHNDNIDEHDDEMDDADEDSELSKNIRYTQRMLDKKVERDDEFFSDASVPDLDKNPQKNHKYSIGDILNPYAVHDPVVDDPPQYPAENDHPTMVNGHPSPGVRRQPGDSVQHDQYEQV